MTEDDYIVKEYKQAFKKYKRQGIVDLDTGLKHKFSFQVHRLEDYVSQLEGIIPPNRHSHYYIALIKRGSGQKSIGHFTFSIKKNTLFCIPKRVLHSSQYWSLDCAGYMLSFSLDFFLQKGFPSKLISNKKIFKASVKPYILLQPHQEKKVALIFETIIEEHQDAHKTRNELIAVKILELLIQCDRLFTAAQITGKEVIFHDTLEKFNELLGKNYTEQRSVAFYAAALHIHPNYLNFLSRKHSGISAKQIINQYLLNEARYLLASSILSIKEIAYKLGFEYPEYFYSFFRRHLHVTPGRYRAQLV